MAVIQPHSPPRPKRTRRHWLAREWQHYAEMSSWTICLLFLPSIVLIVINPLLPFAAYLLQCWAGASFTWRDRWASNREWAKSGAWFVAIVIILAVLASRQVWIFPQLVAWVQMVWSQAHLGDLSLSPADPKALLARCLLLLPLAPALSLYYEWIDPRTRGRGRRVLTHADLVEPPPPPAPPSPAQTASTAPSPEQPSASRGTANAQSAKTAPPATARRSRAAQMKRRSASNPHTQQAQQPQQMTIDSILPSAGQAPMTPPSPSTTGNAARQGDNTPHTPSPPLTTQKTGSEPINWDDVAE